MSIGKYIINILICYKYKYTIYNIYRLLSHIYMWESKQSYRSNRTKFL